MSLLSVANSTHGVCFFSVCWNVRGLTLSELPCWEMKLLRMSLFLPLCLSWNVFIPNKPVFTLKAAPGRHSIPGRLLGGAIGFPANKQADLRALPPGRPRLLMVTLPVQFFFFWGGGRKTQIFAAITWVKASERRCLTRGGGYKHSEPCPQSWIFIYTG